VLLGNGDGTYQPAVAYAAGSDARFVAVVDFDLDGAPDLVTASSLGDVDVLLGNGDGTFQPKVSFASAMGEVSTQVAGADLNGDDLPDIVTANVNSHDVTVLFNLCATPTDGDVDGVSDAFDNCPGAPNGPDGGTCTAGVPELIAEFCVFDSDCGSGGFCSLDQEDYNTDGLGDACDPTIVPEPSVWLQLGTGLAFLAVLYRRRVRRLRIG
jgi:hypothetical protein